MVYLEWMDNRALSPIEAETETNELKKSLENNKDFTSLELRNQPW